MGVDLAVQRAIRARLVGSAEVTALVPATSIVDSHQQPAPRPGIVLGETQLADEGSSLQRAHTRVWHTIHVWKREPSLEGAKEICAAIRAALMNGRLALAPGFHAADLRVSTIRALRDPDGETSHGIVTVQCLVAEVQA